MIIIRKRNNKIVFYLDDKELDKLTRNIQKTGLSREAYIRMIIFGTVPKERPSADFFEVLRQLRMIGNNIQQVAIKANTLNLIDAPMYRQNFSEIQNMVGNLLSVMNKN
ncbi:MAG: plasmid mobilization relaxosome protein MobC [Clostridia bacterium]|nr:plasmid mobilization relaxosome protein MobC [Clostridia bacterium]